MNIISIIILLGISIACAYIHKSKGYSPITGFLWGFFFSIIGLIVVLLEKDKSEHDAQGISMSQWILIFLGLGFVLFALLAIFVMIMY